MIPTRLTTTPVIAIHFPGFFFAKTMIPKMSPSITNGNPMTTPINVSIKISHMIPHTIAAIASPFDVSIVGTVVFL
jgi:hypothetical protein